MKAQPPHSDRGLETASRGPLRGVWWRASAYEVRDGRIRPARGAVIERYELTHEPLVAAVLDLVRIVVRLPRAREARREQQSAPIVEWCRSHGLLGFGLHNVIGPQRRARADPIKLEVPAGRAWREGGVAYSGTRLAPIGQYEPATYSWWLHYSEPIDDVVASGLRLARFIEVFSRSRDAGTRAAGRGEAVHLDLRAFDALVCADRRTFAIDERGRLVQQFTSTSLLAALAGALADNLMGDRATRFCARPACRLAFQPRKPGQTHCTRTCTKAHEVQRARSRVSAVLLLRSQGKRFAQIAAELGLGSRTVDIRDDNGNVRRKSISAAAHARELWTRGRILVEHSKDAGRPLEAIAKAAGVDRDVAYNILNQHGRKRGVR